MVMKAFLYLKPCLHATVVLQNKALQLCIKISRAIDRVEYMFTTEFEAEVEESESATLHQYYREAMIQGYNFAFEVKKKKKSTLETLKVDLVRKSPRVLPLCYVSLIFFNH